MIPNINVNCVYTTRRTAKNWCRLGALWWTWSGVPKCVELFWTKKGEQLVWMSFIFFAFFGDLSTFYQGTIMEKTEKKHLMAMNRFLPENMTPLGPSDLKAAMASTHLMDVAGCVTKHLHASMPNASFNALLRRTENRPAFWWIQRTQRTECLSFFKIWDLLRFSMRWSHVQDSSSICLWFGARTQTFLQGRLAANAWRAARKTFPVSWRLVDPWKMVPVGIRLPSSNIFWSCLFGWVDLASEKASYHLKHMAQNWVEHEVSKHHFTWLSMFFRYAKHGHTILWRTTMVLLG